MTIFLFLCGIAYSVHSGHESDSHEPNSEKFSKKHTSVIDDTPEGLLAFNAIDGTSYRLISTCSRHSLVPRTFSGTSSSRFPDHKRQTFHSSKLAVSFPGHFTACPANGQSCLTSPVQTGVYSNDKRIYFLRILIV